MTCPDCGGDQLSWSQMPHKTTQVVDGRLRLNETTTLFSLGCDSCSETIQIWDAEEIAQMLNLVRWRPVWEHA